MDDDATYPQVVEETLDDSTEEVDQECSDVTQKKKKLSAGNSIGGKIESNNSNNIDSATKSLKIYKKVPIINLHNKKRIIKRKCVNIDTVLQLMHASNVSFVFNPNF